jgi:hypothetical protein
VTVEEYGPLELLHRLQYWLLLAAAGALAVTAWRRRLAQRDAPTAPTPHLMIVAAMMSVALAMMLLLYTLTNWAEHRVLSAFLLCGALLSVAAPGRMPLVLAGALVASNVLTASTFLRSFEQSRRDHFIWDRRGVYTLEDALAGNVSYRADQPRWCNTLLTSQFPPYLIAVPPGIGLSVVREPDQLRLPPRSRYLLLDEPAQVELKDATHITPIAELPYGTLYYNLDADCD